MTPRTLAASAAVAALLALQGCARPSPPPTDLRVALETGSVQAKAEAQGDDAGATSVTLTRFSGDGPLAVTIPAGTVLYSGSNGAQRLITGKTVVIVFRPGQTTASESVRTFCMDEFRLTPTSGVQLSPVASLGDDGTTTEETEPLHKLVDCMSDAPQDETQIAVWAVNQDLLHKTREEAIGAIRDGLLEEMKTERRDQLEAKRPELMQGKVHLTEDRLTALLDQEFMEDQPELQRMADEQAHAQVEKLIARDRDQLARCGYPTDGLPLFA